MSQGHTLFWAIGGELVTDDAVLVDQCEQVVKGAV
jgi:hypothetical protein